MRDSLFLSHYLPFKHKPMIKYIIKSAFPELLSDSYRYKTDKAEVSMLLPCTGTNGLFEIFCIEGNLFSDIERFATKEEAEKRIERLLLGGKKMNKNQDATIKFRVEPIRFS